MTRLLWAGTRRPRATTTPAPPRTVADLARCDVGTTLTVHGNGWRITGVLTDLERYGDPVGPAQWTELVLTRPTGRRTRLTVPRPDQIAVTVEEPHP